MNAHVNNALDSHAASGTTTHTHDQTIVHLPLFKAGMHVTYQGKSYTVSHVVVRRGELMVNLQELGQAVESEKVRAPITRVVLKRR